jgi:hypothetical protein
MQLSESRPHTQNIPASFLSRMSADCGVPLDQTVRGEGTLTLPLFKRFERPCQGVVLVAEVTRVHVARIARGFSAWRPTWSRLWRVDYPSRYGDEMIFKKST